MCGWVLRTRKKKPASESQVKIVEEGGEVEGFGRAGGRAGLADDQSRVEDAVEVTQIP